MNSNAKEIRVLEEKIMELEEMSKAYGLDVQPQIKSLYGTISDLKKDAYDNMTAWDRVCMARSANRPTALAYIEAIFDDFMEYHGDRLYGDDPSVVGGIAMLGDMPVTVIAQQKGRSTKENIERNFGMCHPEGYRKALRLMKQAEKFNRPVVCLVDTPGAFCGIEAEQRGQGEAIARNLMELAMLKVPIISIVIGEGGSGGALAINIADEVWMLENSVYSILSPEGFASILWKDASRAKEAAGVMKLTAKDLLSFGIIEKLIKEPVGGVQEDFDTVASYLKEQLTHEFQRFNALKKEDLIEKRHARLRFSY